MGEEKNPTPQGTESPSGGESGTGAVGNNAANQTFTQSDVDSAVNKAVENAKKQWKKEADEASALAKLSKEDREKKLFENEKTKFENEKAQFEHDKLVLETEKQLSGKNLPVDFAELLTGKDADSTLKNINAFEAAFSKAVEAAVKNKLKASGGTPKTGGTQQTASGVEAAFYKLNPRLRK